jgi:hypothetical protein
VIVLVALVAIAAGLYATGPKYIVVTDRSYQAGFGQDPLGGTHLRRLSAWERIYYAVVGSSKTRG